jgi:hypothetical protein
MLKNGTLHPKRKYKLRITIMATKTELVKEAIKDRLYTSGALADDHEFAEIMNELVDDSLDRLSLRELNDVFARMGGNDDEDSN